MRSDASIREGNCDVKRLIFNALAIASAALLAAAVVLWIRGYRHGDSFNFEFAHGKWFGITSQPNMLRWEWGWSSTGHAGFSHTSRTWGVITPVSPELAALGIRHGPTRPPEIAGARWGFGEERGKRYRVICVPPWFAVFLLGLLPAAALSRFALEKHRRVTNRCVHCGYDLRATPERCPECGAVPGALKGVAT
jgi:hypothetical protein